MTTARATLLEKILAVKREELAARMPGELQALRMLCGPSERRSLAAALQRPTGAPVRVLAEIKRASPSAGPIRPGADAADIARAYTEAGASALSVLTDKQFFDGDISYLAKARHASPLPILRKDFLIDPYQIQQAQHGGADAVLLIVAALSALDLQIMAREARRAGLEALVEVHDLAELDAAIAAPVSAKLVGVNHRDLRTFQIDMTLTEQIAKRVPADVILVAESGIKTADDVRRLGDAGAHAVLVGEQLMRAPDPREALLALRGAP
jgi:indole-3-glycerol phosphate synthase